MRPMTVGGIDPSSKRVLITSTHRATRKKFEIHEIKLHQDSDHGMSCHLAFQGVAEYALDIRDATGMSPRLYLEAPIMGVGGPGATIPQAFVEGAIMAAAYQTECEIYLVNNQTWKKRAMGAGNLNKNQVTERMAEVWPEFYEAVPFMTKGPFKNKKDQDIIDSGGINLHGWRHTLMIERLKKGRGK